MNAENPVGERIQPGALAERVRQISDRGLRSGALRSIRTESAFIEEAGARFLVRSVSSLVEKDRVRVGQGEARLDAAARTDRNPFLPYDRDLYVGDLSDTHVALLNKFNVVDQHLLMVTRAFEDQRRLLTRADFEAAWFCLAEVDGLVFYNGGEAGGASQPHKHLQMVPLPLADSGPDWPIEPLLAAGAPVPFPLAMSACGDWAARAEADLSGVAEESQRVYQALLAQVDRGADAEGFQTGAYNLLLSRRRMVLVPRVRESVAGMSLNALAYAGAFLVRRPEQFEALRTRGPLAFLAGAALT